MWAQASGFVTKYPYDVYCWQAYVPPGAGLWPMAQECTELLLVPLLWVGWSFMLLIYLSLSYSINVHSFGSLTVSDLILLPSLHGGVGLHFQVAFHPMTRSFLDLVHTHWFGVKISSIHLYVLNFFLGNWGFRYCKGTYVSGYSLGAAVSASFVAGYSLMSILQAGDWARFPTPVRHHFQHKLLHIWAPWFHTACCPVLSE